VYLHPPEGPGGSGSSGGAIGNGSIGGGLDRSLLTLSGCIFSNNVSGIGLGGYCGNGGAFFNTSTAIVSTCTFSSNSAYYFGYYGFGGAIFSSQRLIVSNCTFSGNFAANGGAASDLGTLDVSASTISGNLAARFGGAIFSTGTLRMASCTVVNNQSYIGIASSIAHYPGDNAYVRNCIVNGGYYGNFTSEGHNLLSPKFETDGPGDISGAPSLGPLTDNGGPTRTHALPSGSPALDAGDDTLTGTDQRGRPRRSGAHVDIGAFEFSVPSPQNPGVRRLTDGTSQFTFTTLSDVNFNVLASTNISLPRAQWLDLGPPTLITNGLYEFTEPVGTSNRHRFFQLRWP